MKNAFLNFETLSYDDLFETVNDYSSFNKEKFFKYVNSCSNEMFGVIYLGDDDKLERISYKLYGTADYFDILILLNNLAPLIDMPYNYDTLLETVNEDIAKYESSLIFPLNELTKNIMRSKKLEEILLINEQKRKQIIVKPESMAKFILNGKKEKVFK